MGSKPRSLESILRRNSKEEADLLEQYEQLELLKKVADQFSDRYVVGTNSTGTLALYFPNEQLENQTSSQSCESIPDNAHHAPKISIKEYIINKQLEQQEEEAKKKAQEEEEELKKKKAKEEEEVKNKQQNFKFTLVNGDLFVQEFDYVTPPPENQEATVLIHVKNERKLYGRNCKLPEYLFTNMKWE